VGVSTFLELVKDDALARLGADIVRRLGIVGPVKLDFKRDPATGRTCLLEVNSRFNLWHYLGAASGMNLPLLAWGDLSGRPLPRPLGYSTGTRWVSFAQDLKSFLQDYRPAGEFGWGSWIGSFRGRTIFDTFAWDDPRPLAFYLWRHLRRLVAGRAAAVIATV
jgi:predicted ATP-grasp superfamily ATP-dependent carboligase